MTNSKMNQARKLAHSKMAYQGSPRLLMGEINWKNPEKNLLSRAAHEAAMEEAKTESEVLAFAEMAARAAELMS